jgi:hypothetical protein
MSVDPQLPLRVYCQDCKILVAGGETGSSDIRALVEGIEFHHRRMHSNMYSDERIEKNLDHARAGLAPDNSEGAVFGGHYKVYVYREPEESN